MSDKRQKRKVVERREAGIKAMSAPPPRHLPDDHPARSVFKEVAAAEKEQDTPTTSTTTTSTTPTTTTTITPVAPARDFMRVPNSIVRQAIPGGFFTGKSKQLYDCLLSMTRGAIVPVRTVRISMERLALKAGIGSDRTLRKNLRRLIDVGLVAVNEIGGAQGGNEFTVYFPEETTTPTTPTTTTSTTTPTTITSDHPYPSPNVPVVQVVESDSGRGGLNTDTIEVYADSNTSFKTNTIDDDEAFAGLVATLRECSREVTGKEPSAADHEQWRELGQLLATELKTAAVRTTVSSAPAFLTEHLRRRLTKLPLTQPARQTPSVEPQSPSTVAPPTDDDFVEMCVSLLHSGLRVEELDTQMSQSIEPGHWPRIRQLALSRFERERAHVAPPQSHS